MTEEEAKTRWCHAAVASHTDPRQMVSGHWLHNCIGSHCMAWREGVTVRGDTERVRSVVRPEGFGWSPASDENCAWDRPRRSVHGGYCGLAGQPR